MKWGSNPSRASTRNMSGPVNSAPQPAQRSRRPSLERPRLMWAVVAHIGQREPHMQASAPVH